jgi:hypothetical protein
MAKKANKKVKVEVLTNFHVGIDTNVEHYEKGKTYMVEPDLAKRASASGLVKVVVEEVSKEQSAKGKEAKK